MGELGGVGGARNLEWMMGGVKHGRLPSFKIAALARSMNEAGERRVVQ
jgi:hypothetical protein